tara:strand:- start:146 stop:361 length:216 start_codon:yes stop_codon:yes gene_type:complete
MKILYRVYQVAQSEMVERVSLSSMGLSADSAFVDIRYDMQDFDSKEEAVQFISNVENMSDAEYEIVKIYRP